VKIEVFAGKKFGNVVKNNNIDAKRLYKHAEYPYEIWSIEKSEAKDIEEICLSENVLFYYSNGEHRGAAYDFLTINGESIIAWQEDSDSDTFNCLTDYFNDCLGVYDNYKIAAYSAYLAKTNGWPLSELWKKLEG
jgi:hypothetical protein